MLKAIVRKSYLKSDAKDFSLWYHQDAELEEVSDLEQEISSLGLKSFDLLYLLPKKSVSIQLPNGTTEQIHVDFNTYVMNILSILANMFGWEDIEDYLLVRMTPGKEPQGNSFPHRRRLIFIELPLRKTLLDEGVADGDTLLLVADQDKAREEKKEARKKKLLSIHHKKVMLP